MKPGISFIRNVAFIALGIIIVALIGATVVEKLCGTDVAVDYIYTSPVMIFLWAFMVVASLIYLIKRRIHHRFVTFLLHISFVVILVGALVTHLFGHQSRIHLRQGDVPVTDYKIDDSRTGVFPFSILLQEFDLEYYPGTLAPMDYVSVVEIIDAGGHRHEGVVSMNHILQYEDYRFYQSGYDADGKGTILMVAHDPYGIAITYTGYLLLLLSILMFFFAPGTSLRALLKSPLLRRTALVILFIGTSVMPSASAPQTLSPQVAEEFGNLYIYYNDRVCPLQTLARDFTTKLYGKPSYKGYTAEQVLTGWFFYYDDWKNEPMIKIKGGEVRELLGIEGKYASLTDFVSVEGYKLDAALQNHAVRTNRGNIDAANEKFNLISMLATGSLLTIYPYDSQGQLTWYSMVDVPTDVPDEQWLFMRSSMSYVAELVALNNDVETIELIKKIRKYQVNEAGDNVVSQSKFNAEKFYNAMSCTKVSAMLALTIGLIAYIFYCRAMLRRVHVSRYLTILLNVILVLLLLYLTTHMILRGYIAGHIPLSNGHETMLFMAWSSLLIAFVAQRRISIALPLGFLIAGFTLLVAMMGEASPRITHLMPVLQSPLLSIHVMVIMLAYSLLAFTFFNGITAVVMHCSSRHAQEDIEFLQLISRITLYPALFLLVVGIFVGAVWANISWGRYWGWDPKEVWAIITMLIYALLLHSTSLRWLQRPIVFHVCCIISFFSVLITYFGVNFILGGMHSYA